jgi:hypothetical protein
VTADLKYDHFLWAKEVGLNLIDADHFCTENVVVPHLAALLREGFPALSVRISVGARADRPVFSEEHMQGARCLPARPPCVISRPPRAYAGTSIGKTA